MNETIEIIKPDFGQLSSIAAQFSESLTFDDWAITGKRLGSIAHCSAWWIGDWINFGLARYCKRGENGKFKLTEPVRMAMENTELEGQTIHNYAWVSKSIQLSLRRDGLTWSHHREIAEAFDKASDQIKWLDKALWGDDVEAGKPRIIWTVSQLRKAIRRSNGEHDGSNEPSPQLFVFARVNQELERVVKRETGGMALTMLPIDQLRALARQLEPTARIIRLIDNRMNQETKEED